MPQTSNVPARRPAPALDHDRLANAIRALSMDAVETAKSGHPGMPMGMADVATVLFSQFLNFSPSDTNWPDRDRFVLSAGHGSMLIYSLLHLTGHADMPMEELKNFRKVGSRTAGHPEYGHASGIETTTGPLGQGLANSVGMALAERLMASRFGDDLVNHHTYCIAGDGCLMEGISHEAASLAGHLGLGKLIVLFDDNGISIDGPTSLSVSDDQLARFKSLGWDVEAIDGHDAAAIGGAIQRAQDSAKPSLIACKTTIGKGAPNKGGTAGSHGAPLGGDEIALAREILGWPHAPFEIPDDISDAWRQIGGASSDALAAWTARHAASDLSAAFDKAISGDIDAEIAEAVTALKSAIAAEKPRQATRVSSQKTLDVIVPAAPVLIGGSADLTGSNNTKAGGQAVITADDFSGSYIHYGVREHGMAAAMNGMALHGGVVPYGGTFLVFTDYCRPSIRLSALMGLRVVYVMTHDSIGLGEDGPTHQPVEHVASLRAIPNLNVYRPADAIETAECWQAALATRDTPSIIALTRQGVATVRGDDGAENKSAKGAYVLAEAVAGPRKVTLLATGSELELALSARDQLEVEGVPTAVISVPCMELFEQQDADYRRSVLGDGGVRVAIEAGIQMGWERYLGDNGGFVGMSSFGASGPAGDLYKHFGITAGAVVKAVRDRL